MARSVVSRYQVLEKLGEGGYGAVYKARDTRVERLVALKFISTHLLDSEQAVERFRREARAVSALSHPHIVVLHDVDTDPETGRMFLVLEYLSGGTLRQLIQRSVEQRSPVDPFELLRCGVAIASGLRHAHRHGILHRDVKSSNVMFSEDRIVKITDFGMAKADDGRDITAPGAPAGTVAYMSPEQARGLDLDCRTDIYSFGVVLYELAAGRLPFTASSGFDLLNRIVTEPTPPLKAVRPDLPEEMDRIIQRATAKQLSERYQDVEQMETDLLALQHRLVSMSEQPTAVLVSAAPPPPKPRRRAVLLMFLAVAAAVLGVVWYGRTPAPPKPARLMAVVPFHCLGAEDAHRAFCEGLANTISNKFTQTEPFQNRVLVVPYSEVRGESITSAAEARKIFKVQLAVTGSVEFIGDAVRIIVNLVDAENTVQTASRTLDSSAAKLVKLQDEASELAAGMLDLKLPPAERGRLDAGRTRDAAAFDAFVRGIGHLGSGEVEDVDPAITLLEEAVRRDPAYAQAHAHLGEAYLAKYQATEDGAWLGRARESCERALRVDRRMAQAHIALANVWLARTEPESAVRELRAALASEPKNADALRALGNAYAAMSRRDPARKAQAIETLTAAIALRPELWTTYRDLGLAYYRMGDFRNAERQFLLMLEFTRSADAYRRVGALYHLMDRPEDAISYLRKSLSIKPTAKAYANLGTVCYYLQRYEEVIPNFENALRLSREERTRNHVIWGNLGMSYMGVPGMRDKGLEALREAIRIAEARLRAAPKHAETHASLAYYLAGVGDKSAALRHAREAGDLAPEEASVQFRRGLVYERLGQRQDALKAIGRAIELGHPMKEVLHAGDLAELRRDPAFQQVSK
ncbi:MAG: protein kinase [Bryobacteraceae bacterium]